MKNWVLAILISLAFSWSCAQEKSKSTYLDSVKLELHKKWPKNRTINLVFHGHSVPSGYLTKGVVDAFGSYPFLSLKRIKIDNKYAVVNAITTSIGGEQSEQGAQRFQTEVLNHKPDVLFIDYALNDRSIGLERSATAWEKMIEEALAYGTKVILMTPTPDLREDIQSNETPLEKHSQQIRKLADVYNVGLVDSYSLFREIAKTEDLNLYMAQNNHINRMGHQVVANAIYEFFNSKNE
ncbi:SGNH/GDSL hydrolase family protein [Spongiivirga citrea]|uniref:SGNH/GDSL hydrolase family protein n=1 Tax=Spongiivirga citrea TaxID=1481457 RepID=A0A6M0CP86_9FLAO|nr:SGNH/GDSL hydrolase family protein [Spongiivirga citrea]NER17864.1 SGNH/GDSL hydrolase family protein [Spongiivirga citrea]